MIFDPVLLQQHITSYYKSLLGTTIRFLTLQPGLWSVSEMLTPHQQLLLEMPFSLDEIRSTLFSCNPSKAPGPDGLSFQFYQSFWNLVQSDLLNLFQDFYHRTLDISKLNLASICLLPKKTDAFIIQNFRPISLINYSFKLITKLLTNRLAQVMDPLIDDSQAAFIKGRLIGDNILCATEVLHQVKLSKQQGILLKLDFKKAFDKVNWDFLFKVLAVRGFGNLFISWIKDILFGGRSCISFNGTLGPYFPCKQGLRHGDPMSHFLFDLVADALNKILSRDQAAGVISSLGNFSNDLGVLNLHFADDTLLFLKADSKMLEYLKFLLLGFELLYGLKINFDKSVMVPLNLSDSLASSLAEQLCCSLSNLHITYLGVPLHTWKKNYKLGKVLFYH